MDQIGGATSVAEHTCATSSAGRPPLRPPANYYNGDLINGYDQAVAFAQQAMLHRMAVERPAWVPLAERPGVVPGTPFLPSEIQDVGQKNADAYAMLRFGSPKPIFGNVRLDGNIGVRFVHDDLTSLGSIGAPMRRRGLGSITTARLFLIPYLTDPTTVSIHVRACRPRVCPLLDDATYPCANGRALGNAASRRATRLLPRARCAPHMRSCSSGRPASPPPTMP